jgi:molybdopterin-guanine dinucleotide biosynthesis protein A
MFTPTNGNSASCHRLSGASLAQFLRRLSPAQRAVLAAEIIDRRIVLTDLTAKTVAAIAGVSLSSVYAALRLAPEQRAAVAAGDLPLVQPRPQPISPAVDWWRLNEDALLAAINGLEHPTVVEAEHAN